MAETRKTYSNSLEVIERPQTRMIDFDRIQVAPQQSGEYEDFNSLDLEQRRDLLMKLIKRVKSI